MEVSVSFTDGTVDKDPAVYSEDRSDIGRVYINKDKVLVTGPVRIRYEKHPWLESFELDGVRAAPARRKGFGTKDARGFIKSLNTIYAKAYDDYRSYGGSSVDEDDAFDVHGCFAHAAEHFLAVAGKPEAYRLYRMFCGFVENMWREGDEGMYHVAMDTVLPLIQSDETAWISFEDNITDEFREYIERYNR